MNTSRRGSGFTLPEILVTVTVSAVLAAAVVPAVRQYANKVNAPAPPQDIQQLQNAVAGFTADVRHYPGDLQQLVSQIVSTPGSGDSLDLDGSASPVQFSAVEAARWRGPYTSAPISTTANNGGQFTSNGLLFTIGRKITLSRGWLTVPILSPVGGTGAAICAAVLSLNKSIDNTTALGQEPADGIITWDGGAAACTGTTPTLEVANLKLRLAPAN
jgi:prepilin-type N-terminal cleavage/methylation domain-containing protein